MINLISHFFFLVMVFAADSICMQRETTTGNINLGRPGDTKVKFVRVQSLNFIYTQKTTSLVPENVSSGPGGNIIFYRHENTGRENNAEKKPFEKFVKESANFDANNLHNFLAQEAHKKKDHNRVTAAFTLIIKKNTKYYAVTQAITNRNENMEVFTSGWGKNLAMLGDWLKRLRRVLSNEFPEKTGMVEYCKTIKEQQKKRIEEDLQKFKEALAEYRTQDIQFLIEIPILFDESFVNQFEDYGSFIDSEQFLLIYLEQKIESIFNRLNEYFSEGEKRKPKMAYEFLGCILHVYSSNENCHFCAQSILYELNENKDNFVTRCKKLMAESGPSNSFFVCLSSWGDQLGENNRADRPSGVMSGEGLSRDAHPDEANQYNINLNQIIANGILPLKQISLAKQTTGEPIKLPVEQ